MNELKDAVFEPAQLTSIRTSFDEARSALSDFGYQLTLDEADQLGRIMIRMSASGIRGRKLVDAAVGIVADWRGWRSNANIKSDAAGLLGADRRIQEAGH